MRYQISQSSCFAILFLLISFKTAASSTHLGSHEHGSATLNIAVDSNSLFVEFGSPAANIVGFEHAAKTDQQATAISAATSTLQHFDKILNIPESAGCRLATAAADWVSDMDEESKQTGHTEFHAEFQLSCDQIESIDYIDVQLFSLFPGIEDLDVQVIAPGGQLAIELSPGQQRIELK